MEADCKSAGYAYASSNLARPTTLIVDLGFLIDLNFEIKNPFARVAQW